MSCKHENNAIFWCVQTVKKHLIVANLPVTLRYIIVICPGIRSEKKQFVSNFQFSCWHEAFIAVVLTYHLFLDGKYMNVALNIYLKSPRRM